MKTILVLTALLLSTFLQAGEAFILFKVVDENDDKLKKASMIVYEGNTLIHEETLRSSKGKFLVEASGFYTIEISLDSHITKRIVVDLRDDLSGTEVYEYTFYVELESIKNYEEIDSSEEYLDYPIAILEPDQRGMNLTYNKEYMRSTQQHKSEVVLSGQTTAFIEE